MAYEKIYKQVMHTYDEDRREANLLLKKRRAEVYAAIPRVAEIDHALLANALDISRLILSGTNEADAGAQKLQQRLTQLQDEKQGLLRSHRIKGDYFTNIYKCGMCQDTGYVGAQRCKCMTQKLIEKYYDLANVKKIVETENFDTFDFRYYSPEVSPTTGIAPLQNIQTIYSNCMDFVSNFNNIFQNLLFYGDTGLGKTFLCNCIAKELLDNGKTVLYVTAPRIFKKIEALRFNREEEGMTDEQIDMIYDVDLLIIDDLGSEFGTSVTNTALFDIINNRVLTMRPVVISTNLALNDFQSHYSDRIVSRFFGHYKMMRFFGEDIRVLKKLKINP